MKNVWFFGSSYIIPNVDTVVLGGTAQKHNYDTSVSLSDSQRILSDIATLFPALAAAPVVSDKTTIESITFLIILVLEDYFMCRVIM